MIKDFPGLFRRRILIVVNAQCASADVEDDAHRFGVDVAHDGEIVTGIAGRALRTPWSSCPAAAAVLTQLVGTPLLASPFAVIRQVMLREHCTHMLDMAALAIAAAARGIQRRIYDVEVSMRDVDGVDQRNAEVRCDGALVLSASVKSGVFSSPELFAGGESRRAASWGPTAVPDADGLEALFVLHRAVAVASGRRVDPDALKWATESIHMQGACYSYGPTIAPTSKRNVGSALDFTDRQNDLLADLLG